MGKEFFYWFGDNRLAVGFALLLGTLWWCSVKTQTTGDKLLSHDLLVENTNKGGNLLSHGLLVENTNKGGILYQMTTNSTSHIKMTTDTSSHIKMTTDTSSHN